MRYPRLRRTVLCQVLMYSPALLFFFLLLLAMLLIALGIDVPDKTFLVLIPVGAAFSLWYLFHFFLLFLASDAFFGEVRLWKKDRLEYVTKRNGPDRADAVRTIRRRCARRFLRRAPLEESALPAMLCFRHAYCLYECYSSLEERVAVYSVPKLDWAMYEKCIGDARRRMKGIPARNNIDKSSRKPPCIAGVVVILADAVEEEVRALARKPVSPGRAGALLPCVAEIPTGKYYMRYAKEYFEPGLMERPMMNFAVTMAERIVFGGRVPRENRSAMLPYELRWDLDMSLWEYLRALRGELRLSRKDAEKEAARMVRRLADGEIRMGEYAIYYKSGSRVAVCDYMEAEDDPKSLMLSMENRWICPPKDRVSLPRKKMDPGEKEDARKRIEAWLLPEGYRIERDGEEE